jgi:hypothetical protein
MEKASKKFLVVRKSSGTTTSPEKYNINKSARYVRITVNGNTQNKWASITEIDVYGS